MLNVSGALKKLMLFFIVLSKLKINFVNITQNYAVRDLLKRTTLTEVMIQTVHC